MNKSKILVGLVLAIYALFVIFQLTGNELIAIKLRSFILPSVALTYFLCSKERSIYFALFFIFYSASDILFLASRYLHISFKIDYYLGNILYILAYGALFIKICKSISLMHVFKNLKIHLLVLTALNIYIIYVLQVITDPITTIAGGYYVEFTYNLVMLLLLSASLINYFYRDNKKSLYIFLGSLCIVFSEVISVAYLYVAKQGLLSLLSTSLALLAFYFYYQQTKFDNTSDVYIVTE